MSSYSRTYIGSVLAILLPSPHILPPLQNPRLLLLKVVKIRRVMRIFQLKIKIKINPQNNSSTFGMFIALRFLIFFHFTPAKKGCALISSTP